MRKRQRSILWAFLGTVAAAGVVGWRLSTPAPWYRLTAFTALTGETIDPRSLNDRGQVAGFIRRAPAAWRMFLWDRTGGMQDLGPVSGRECAINNAGQIATTRIDSNGNEQAALRDPNGAVQLLGTLGGALSVATALNNRGQVVGWSATAPDANGRTVMHAFLWGRASGMRDLGALQGTNSMAEVVNDAGQVHDSRWGRFSRRLFPVRIRYFLWDPQHGKIPLDRYVRGLGSFEVRDLNNQGCILGVVRAKDGSSAAVLLEPIPEHWAI